MVSYHSAIVRIWNRFVIEVRSPQPNLCRGIGRLYAHEVLQVILVRCKNMCKMDEIRSLDSASNPVYRDVVLVVSISWYSNAKGRSDIPFYTFQPF